jgi:hypothetical protein
MVFKNQLLKNVKPSILKNHSGINFDNNMTANDKEIISQDTSEMDDSDLYQEENSEKSMKSMNSENNLQN